MDQHEAAAEQGDLERGRACGFATFENLIAKRMTHAGPVFTLKHLMWKKTPPDGV